MPNRLPPSSSGFGANWATKFRTFRLRQTSDTNPRPVFGSTRGMFPASGSPFGLPLVTSKKIRMSWRFTGTDVSSGWGNELRVGSGRSLLNDLDQVLIAGPLGLGPCSLQSLPRGVRLLLLDQVARFAEQFVDRPPGPV